ncbi:hypothetical protein [Nonlabens tegetincola]|nr:hypothetical protein [Nonlabens tegetincola]
MLIPLLRIPMRMFGIYYQETVTALVENTNGNSTYTDELVMTPSLMLLT